VARVCFVFLLHVRSALVAIITLPIGVLTPSSPCTSGQSVNIIEPRRHRHRHRRHDRRRHRHDRERPTASGAPEAGSIARRGDRRGGGPGRPALFFSLLVITVALLPIFTLEGQEGRMFKPLAWTNSLSMAAAALLS